MTMPINSNARCRYGTYYLQAMPGTEEFHFYALERRGMWARLKVFITHITKTIKGRRFSHA